MNKNAIQKFAIWARNELIAQVSQRAYQYGIDESGFGDASADTLNGRLLTAEEKSQRQELIKQIKEKGYKQVMEEVAYTWFNRFIALRFMEVNNYLPSHIRVFSDASGAFKPEILNDVLHLDLPGLDSGKVAEYIESNDTEALYRYLLLTQCNALNSALPVMFERMGGYTEMLLPNNILRQDSVLGHMVSDIPEEDWQDAVQIIGWLYQYYNTELKDDTFAQLKKNVKITKERIPAATQLFTPDWIVRYMVENSLGRLWLEGHPNAKLHDGWKYYLDEAEQEPEVDAQLAKLREEYKTIKPEEIKVIDPCMGSGHILVYAFDVLMQIYTSAGWNQREAVQSILKNNLYGLDIDDRAAQLAYFAVMMKARQYDRRLLTRGIQPNIHSIIESNALGGAYKLAMGDFLLSKEHQETLNYLLDAFIDAKEYGSILCLEKRDYVGLLRAWNLTASQTTENLNLTLWFAAVEHEIPKLIEQAIILTQGYDVVVTNPPYMKADSMPVRLATYILEKWETAKYDLYAAFIYRAYSFLKKNRITALITMHNFMYSPSFLDMRKQITNWDWIQLLHLGTRAFSEIGGEVVQTAAFVLSNSSVKRNLAVCDLTEIKDADTKKRAFCQRIAPTYVFNLKKIRSIPNHAFGYALSDVILDFYDKNSTLENKFVSKAGVVTGDDDFFCKLWFEVNLPDITFLPENHKLYKYVPFSRGGSFSSWYGNTHHVLRVKDMYNDKLTNKSVRRGDIDFYYRTGIGWSQMGGGINKNFSVIEKSICKTTTPMIYCTNEDELLSILGYLNSPIPAMVLKSLNPTLSVLTSDILHLPFIPIMGDHMESIEDVKNCIQLSREDTDSYETSWDFKRNPLV